DPPLLPQFPLDAIREEDARRPAQAPADAGADRAAQRRVQGRPPRRADRGGRAARRRGERAGAARDAEAARPGQPAEPRPPPPAHRRRQRERPAVGRGDDGTQGPPEVKGFRYRGESPSRIEGLSDCVFAFAVTLLVVSLDVPKTFQELYASLRGFAVFAV